MAGPRQATAGAHNATQVSYVHTAETPQVHYTSDFELSFGWFPVRNLLLLPNILWSPYSVMRFHMRSLSTVQETLL